MKRLYGITISRQTVSKWIHEGAKIVNADLPQDQWPRRFLAAARIAGYYLTIRKVDLEEWIHAGIRTDPDSHAKRVISSD